MTDREAWEKRLSERGQAGRPSSLVKRSKYGNSPTEVDGMTFASLREARRYTQLKAMQSAGDISGLALQVQFPLNVVTPLGVVVTVGRYICDFHYVCQGRTVVEDAKGMRTETYKWKKKHVEAQYAIEISEV